MHKCFISYKKEDVAYRNYIIDNFGGDNFVNKSLDRTIDSYDGDYVMKVIRQDYLCDSTVTLFLIGTHSSENEGTVYSTVEQMPMFPGGDEALLKWLYDNLKYPSIAQDNGIQGRVMVQFTVNKDGSIVEPKVMRSVDTSLDNEAMRVIKSMPKWNPGKQRGKAVRVRYTVPVLFRLQ